MKHFYLFATLLYISLAHSQCPPGSVTFTTQAQVNNFIAAYPGCTAIAGDVSITGNNITNLQGLANITAIAGALEIREAGNLANLMGLNNLVSVGTDLILREVDELENVNALSSLVSIGGEFTVRECPELQNLDGVENLTSVGLGLVIRDCETLTSIAGLSGVTFVGEILEVVGCPLLESLAGLENIGAVLGGEEGALVIEDNTLLTSLEGLGNAETVFGGGITISTNSVLSYCAVPSICKYLQDPPEGAVIAIGLNVTGCNSALEVIAACDPVLPPVITSFTPANSCVGSVITIEGAEFREILSVTVGGTPVAAFAVTNETQITITLGNGTTGPMTITNTAGSVTSTAVVTVNPLPLPISVIPANTIACTGEVVQLTAASGNPGAQYVWSPVTGLYTDAAATIQYTGAGANTVYAMPETTSNYTVSYTNPNGCTTSAQAIVTVINTPPPTADDSQSFCNEGIVAGLSATGENVQWYESAAGGNVLSGSTQLVNGAVYYASQTANGCESITRTPVAVIINTTPTGVPNGNAIQQFCNAATIQDLVIEGNGSPIWYDAAVNGSIYPADTPLVDGNHYYASQVVLGCESTEKLAVQVLITSVSVDEAVDVSACNSYLLPELTNGAYYTLPHGEGTAIEPGTEITSTTTLYIFNSAGEGLVCNAEDSFTVIINTVPAPDGNTVQVIELTGTDVATIEDIELTPAPGATIHWYETEEAALTGEDELATGTVINPGVYYAMQTIGNCASAQPLAVTTDVVLANKGFDNNSFTYYLSPVTEVLNLTYSSAISGVKLFNLLGQEVMSLQPDTTTATINMSALAGGLYIVTVSSGDMSTAFKVLKK